MKSIFKRKKPKRVSDAEQEAEKSLEDKIKESLSMLDIGELYELGKSVSEKHLDKDSELYKYFHNYTIKYVDNDKGGSD